MSLFGDLLGYDYSGNDLLGVNRDYAQNCIICGRSVYIHSDLENAKCWEKFIKQTQEDKTCPNP